MSLTLLVVAYLFIGIVLAHGRAADVAAHDPGNPVGSAAYWIVTWPLWWRRK